MIRALLVALLVLALGSSASAQGEDLERARRIEELIGSLEDPDEDVRWEAVLLLGEIGPAAAPAVPSLERALEDPAEDVRREVVSALQRIGPPAVVPALARALECSDVEVRCRAAQVLGAIGRRAAAAVPSLSRALDDPDVREAAAESLARMGGPSAVAALVEALGRPRQDVRVLAAWALAGDDPCPITPQTATLAVPALIQALGDPVRDIRAAAACALGNTHAMTDATVPALVRSLEDPEIFVRSIAAESLGKLAPAAAPAVVGLTRALGDADQGAPAPSPLPLAGTEPGAVRRRAALALAEIGPPAAPAVPALIRALGDPVPQVRQGARDALVELGLDLEQEGTVMWWVVPRAYWLELTGLVVVAGFWFALMARFPRRRPSSTLKQAALFAITALVPALLVCSATGYAVTRDWAYGFLPRAVLSVLPFPAAAVLSAGFLCALAAAWACWRKPAAAGVDPDGPPGS